MQLSLEDRTKRAYGQVDYIQAFTAGGNHNLKAGFGVQHTSNTVDNTYPGGGYVFVWWDRAFTSQATGLTDRGPYGYYEVNDFGTRGEASADILSLYVQDQWSINNLTLNLGLRTEREVIPSFRTDIKAEGFKFNFGDKLAPRLGLSYDVHGDGRFKVYGNWGRYFDWTKYELSRGGFGGDIWRVQYRSLDTTDVFSLSGTNLPGRNLWTPEAGSFRDLRIPNFDTVDPNLKPMSQDAMNAGFEYQLKGNQTRDCELHAQQPAPDDRRSGRARKRQRGLQVRQPRRRHRGRRWCRRACRSRLRRPSRSGSTTRWKSRGRSASRTTGSAAPATSTAASTATTRACPTRTRSRRPPRAAAPARRSSRPAASRVRAAAPTGRGTSTSCCGTATATWTCWVAWRRIVRMR